MAAAMESTGSKVSGNGMAWVVTKRDIIKARITKFRAGLPLAGDVAVAFGGGCLQVRCLADSARADRALACDRVVPRASSRSRSIIYRYRVCPTN